jgi:SPP1 gp7 family putative phage head morphogenesis protein
MLADVSRRDERVWRSITEGMGAAMREELRSAPMLPVLAELEAEQVRLITSLPTEAAERVHKLTVDGMADGTRASEIAKEIMRSGEVTQSRANLIARTEVGRASGKITETRALSIDSQEYIWRTAKDSDVRPDHRALEGKVIRWDSPPIADKRTGIRAHAGCIWECRCYAEPIIPQKYRA